MANLGTTVLAAFAQLKSGAADCVVSVVIDGTAVDGIRSTRRGAGELIDAGYTNRDAQTVWVPTANAASVNNGKRITVGGEVVEVVSAAPDPAGALTRIDYQFRPAATGVRP